MKTLLNTRTKIGRVAIIIIIGFFFYVPLEARPDSLLLQENSFFKAIRANQTDSYITFSQGFGNVEPLIFEGLIAPYFLLRTSKDSKWGATLSPAIMIRMYSEESFPVRTPSYIPEITFYHLLSSRNNKNVQYLFLNLVHHSNGQDGSFFNDDGTYNVRTGDFSTNFIELGMVFNKNIVPFTNTNEYFQTSVEYHVGLKNKDELNGRYSKFRWHNNFRIFRLPKYTNTNKLIMNRTPAVQTKIETTWMFGTINNASFFNLKERFNLSFTISYKPKFLSDVSLFANFYSGKDYYNMHFYRRISVFRVGLQAYSFK